MEGLFEICYRHVFHSVQLLKILLQRGDDVLRVSNSFIEGREGSKQIRIFPGLVGVGSRSLITMLEIQSVS